VLARFHPFRPTRTVALFSGPFARVTVANFFFFLNFAWWFLLPLAPRLRRRVVRLYTQQ
jgi:hypothetical protein